ncbi:MAG: serine hydrolase [Pseudomonadota bacterium]
MKGVQDQGVAPKPTIIPTEAPGRAGTTLGTWRDPEHSIWAFHHLREIVPTAEIASADRPASLPEIQGIELAEIDSVHPDASALLADTRTTALVVLYRGQRVLQGHRLGYDGRAPHLIFSISKSLTGLLCGILAAEGGPTRETPLETLLPELAGSAYAGATLGHALDMTVSTGFEESYLDRTGDYVRYREATGWNPVADDRAPSDLNSFLARMRPGTEPHGRRFHYVSPNSDLLGWVIERATGQRYGDLVAERIWRPLGAEASASVSLDRLGAPRSAGGVSVRPRDLARFGEMVRLGGRVGTCQVVPADWIAAMAAHDGDTQARQAWVDGDMAELFPQGSYRAQWYRTGRPSGAIAAIGIHGQWLWIDPAAEMVIAKTSAQASPIDDALDQRTIALFDRMGRWLEAGGLP